MLSFPASLYIRGGQQLLKLLEGHEAVLLNSEKGVNIVRLHMTVLGMPGTGTTEPDLMY